MNKQDLMDAMSGIKPEFIAEAQEQRGKKPLRHSAQSVHKIPFCGKNYVSAFQKFFHV